MANSPDPQLISYITLRKAIGFIGILLPIVLVLGSFITWGKYTEAQPSISDYYFTTMGDVFVGSLCAVALFLFCYKGHERIDGIMANIAAFFVVLVSLFPTSTKLERIHTGLTGNEDVAKIVHFTSAALFFTALALFSLVLFKRSNGHPTKQKRRRNMVYTICGWIMVGCILAIAAYNFVPGWEDQFRHLKPTIVFETIALWAFGISWLTKGEAILSDKEARP
jgi:uncharacterized protein DUF998